jgi:hypothetical protein
MKKELEELNQRITEAHREMGRFPTTNCEGYKLASDEFTRLTSRRYEIIHGLPEGTLTSFSQARNGNHFPIA